jgi:hypothetical protein
LPVAANTKSAARWLNQQLFLSFAVVVFVKAAYLEQIETYCTVFCDNSEVEPLVIV